MVSSNRLVAALLVVGALAPASSASAQSMKSNATFEQAVHAESVVVSEWGLAPLTGGDLPPACVAKLGLVKASKTDDRVLSFGSGYQGGLCEAEEVARDNLRRAIAAIIARRAEIVAAELTPEQLDAKVSEAMAAARVSRRKLWLDRGLAEVHMQVSLDQSPRQVAR